MAQIIETLKNCTIATVAKSATLTNNNLTYTASGKPGANIHLFTKTITRAADHIFKIEPVIDFSETTLPPNEDKTPLCKSKPVIFPVLATSANSAFANIFILSFVELDSGSL